MEEADRRRSHRRLLRVLRLLGWALLAGFFTLLFLSGSSRPPAWVEPAALAAALGSTVLILGTGAAAASRKS